MIFIIQTDCEELNVESLILEDVIAESKAHGIYRCTLDMVDKIDPSFALKAIPVGSIEFVSKFVKAYYSIRSIHSLEIPECLRTQYFLKRNYQIVKYKDIPEEGEWFIKDITSIKGAYAVGYNKKTLPEHMQNPQGVYQVSEIVDVHSEWRVYVIDNVIENICNYNGSPSDISSLDLDVALQAIVTMAVSSLDMPKSYTIDLMVTDRGTSIVEIHPFVCVGLYSTVWGENLLYAYRDGFRYLVGPGTIF